MSFNKEWVTYPETKHVVKVLEEEIERLTEAWKDGAYLGNELEGTRTVGHIQGLTQAIEYIKHVGRDVNEPVWPSSFN